MLLLVNPEQLTDISSYCQFDLLSKQQTDVTFITKDKRSVAAHKIVLSSLGHFMKMLCKESDTILLPHVEYEAVAAFLCLLYTGEAVIKGPGQVQEFSELMDMLCILLPDCVKEQMVARCDVGQIESKDVLHEVLEISPAHVGTVDDEMVAGPSHLQSECSPVGSVQDWMKEECEAFPEKVSPPSRSPVLECESPVFLNCDGSIKVEDVNSMDNDADPLNLDSDYSGGAESNMTLDASDIDSGEPNRPPLQAQDSEYRFHCPYCSKGSNDSYRHSLHVRTHTAALPYSCPHCEKKFKLKPHLSNHLRVHIGETPYQCIECNKSFRFRSQLMKHNRMHTDLRPFECPECKSTFKDSYTLKSHSHVHTKERPFQCPMCKKRFKVRSHLRTHFKIHVRKHVSAPRVETCVNNSSTY